MRKPTGVTENQIEEQGGKEGYGKHVRSIRPRSRRLKEAYNFLQIFNSP